MAPESPDELGRSLVFEGGDVIMHTSEYPSGIFVVHKDVLIAKSGYFRGILSKEWGKIPHVKVSGTLPIHELDLRLDCEHGFALPVLRRNPRAAGSFKSRSTSADNSEPVLFWYDEPRFTTSQPEPRSPHWRRRQPKHWPRSKDYESFLRPSETSIPLLSEILEPECKWKSFMYAHERSLPSHHQILAYVRSIWRCIFRLMYGKDKILQHRRRACVARDVVFVANLYTYAELLALDDSILTRLKCILRKLPNLWKLVSRFPHQFIDLGYYLAMPDIYLDAIKHLASWPTYRAPTLSGGKDREYCDGDEEKLQLLMAAKIEHDYEVTSLMESLSEFTNQGICNIDTGLEGIQIPSSDLLPAAHQESDLAEYMLTVRKLFMDKLLPKLFRFRSEKFVWSLCPLEEMTTVEFLRFLFDLAGPQSLQGEAAARREVIVSIFALENLAVRSGLDLSKLTSLVELVLVEYRKILGENAAFSLEVEHACRENPRQCLESDRQHYFCPVCPRTMYRRPELLNTIEPYTLCQSHPKKPWPLELDPFQEVELELPVAYQTIPTDAASYAYLKSIGLGQQFDHLAAAAAAAAQEIQSQTSVHDETGLGAEDESFTLGMIFPTQPAA